MAFYDGLEDYTLEGLMAPIDWQPLDFGERQEFDDCVVASQWDEERGDFERISPMPYCDKVPGSLGEIPDGVVDHRRARVRSTTLAAMALGSGSDR